MGLYKRLLVCLCAYLVSCCLTSIALAAHRNDIVGDSLGSRAITFAFLSTACPSGGGQPGTCVPQVAGTNVYCSDCAQTTPCLGSGTGAWATFLNGGWQCGPSVSPALVTPQCRTLTGSNSTFSIVPTLTAYPVTECLYWVLGTNATISNGIGFLGSPAPGWTYKIFIREPLVGGPFSFALSNGGANPFVLTSGCPSFPSMPTGAKHGIDAVIVFDAATTTLNVEACNTTGN